MATGGRITDRRHREWTLNHVRWRWLLDSYMGGDQYRQAVYGLDAFGCPLYNLRRHKREAPIGRRADSAPNAPGSDPSSRAGEDDFQLRRAGTPVPDFVREAVDVHLATIYESAASREGPDSVVDWWRDVDGCGSSIDDWMRDNAAPLLCVFGQLDFVVDRRPIPGGAVVRTLADQSRLGVNRPVASYILPHNMLWWSLDDSARYRECLVREPQDDGEALTRHWKPDGWDLYDAAGRIVGRGEYPYGRPPIVRCFDRLAPGFRYVGKSRYEANAELMRDYYNRNSELILSDTTQAFPLLQGPEDYMTGDQSIPIGPNYVLPMKKVNSSGGSVLYQGFEIIDFPKGAADSIRLNLQAVRDASDRAACLTRPAGAAGTNGSTVAQSGISKRLDASNGNKLLGKIAATLARAERSVAELALTVARNGRPDEAELDSIMVRYPGSFDLFSVEELTTAVERVQAALAASGQAPVTEGLLIRAAVKQVLHGLEPDDYRAIDDEIQACVDSRARDESMRREAAADHASD